MTEHKIIQGDCIEQMRLMEENSIDAIVTDPPYELGFMGKSWDSTGIAFNVQVWVECLRVLKPGGHLLAFSGSRTYHRMAVAIEDAGFEIRDQIMWIYGSGFPKSLDVSKAIDKAAGAEREALRVLKPGGQSESTGRYGAWGDGITPTAPATAAAKQWQGWGTALKPAHEPIVVARKPLIGTVAANVLTYGTGGLNIDGARVGTDENLNGGAYATEGTERDDGWGMQRGGAGNFKQPTGRWPANVIHDGSDEVVELFPYTKGTVGNTQFGSGTNSIYGKFSTKPNPSGSNGISDSGSAARFFYCAKASKRDRNEGLDGFEEIRIHDGREEGGVGGSNPRNRTNNYRQNHHPTVKPTDLMRYLCRLITPPNGVVLDPFMGSGSTGKASIFEGFRFVGIEQNAEYVEIAKARIEFAGKKAND